MMADKGKRSVVGVAESVVFDKNDDHAPRGGGFGPVVVLRPGMQGIAASRRLPRLRFRNEFFPPAYPCATSPQDVVASSVMRFPSQLVVSAPRRCFDAGAT